MLRPLPCLLTLLLTSQAIAQPDPLAPGHYRGVCQQGFIDLTLRSDQTAHFGGVDYTWQQQPGRLNLQRKQGADLTFTVGPDFIEGPICGRIWLTPMAGHSAQLTPKTPTRTPKPPTEADHALTRAITGTWRFTATGGTLLLELLPSGAMRMRQQHGDEAAPLENTGRWRVTAGPLKQSGALTLETDGGGPLRYDVRWTPERLFVRGGDLPTEVGFIRVEEAP